MKKRSTPSGSGPSRSARGRTGSFTKSKTQTRDKRPAREGDRRSTTRGGGRYSERSRDRDDRRVEFIERPRMTKGPWKMSAYQTSPQVHPVNSPKRAPLRATTAEKTENDGKERLQKTLARCRVASRRKAELLILEGAVTVNGKPVVELGTKVNPKTDKIKVNGKLIFTEVDPIYVALYKPKGMISALSDPEGREHIGLLVRSIHERLIPIGRLDYNTEGLMLLTNDGDLAEKIFKARGLPKVYMVKVKGHPKPENLKELQRGIFTAEGVVRFSTVGLEQTLKSKSWIKLEVTEGAGLDLKELLNHRGLLVDRIVRTAVGSVSVQGLEPGDYRLLKKSDFERLLGELVS